MCKISKGIDSEARKVTLCGVAMYSKFIMILLFRLYFQKLRDQQNSVKI